MIRTMAMAAALLCAGTAQAQLGVVQGPVEADVTRILDGDTVEFTAYPFPDIAIAGTLRIEGIDTPEKTSSCVAERQAAEQATTFALNYFAANKNRIRMYVIGLRGSTGGKFTRYLARVKVGSEWFDDRMIAEGHARRNKGEKRLPWC